MKKYSDAMSWDEINRNSLDISGYFKKLSGDWTKKDYTGLRMVLSFPDATYFVDADGNLWSEYVPTYD